MLLEHIRFKNRQSLKFDITSKNDIGLVLRKLGLGLNRPVIVIVGGAGGVQENDRRSIRDSIAIIAKIAKNVEAALVDGGTDSGVMAEIGILRSSHDYKFPLIGVAAGGTVNWPGRKMGLLERLSFNFRD